MRTLFDATVLVARVVSQGLDVEDISVFKLPCLNDCTLLLFAKMGQTGRCRITEGAEISACGKKCVATLMASIPLSGIQWCAKRLGGPNRYRWVTDEILGVQKGEEDVRIDSETPLEAVRRASFLSSQQLAGWKARKPSIVEPWQRTVHTCLHPELRIILYFGRTSDMEDGY